MAPIVFVLGGARSGKSRFAEERTRALSAGERVYVATAECLDDEMRQRVEAHRRSRGADWRTVAVEAARATPPTGRWSAICATPSCWISGQARTRSAGC